MGLRAISTDVYELIDRDAEVERVATGFLFTEGPVWHRDGQYLLFSDMPGDVMRKWSERQGILEFRKPCSKSNGLTFDAQGRLIACEHASRRVTRTEADGTINVLASQYQGKPLNSPNDVVVKSDGSIYFTDPPYGLMDYYGIARPQDLSFQGVYRISPSGDLQLLVDDFEAPNGLCFSPDESLLYIDDSPRMQIRVFEVRADGSLTSGKLFFDFTSREHPGDGGPDGMKIDERGNLYSTGPGGIWIINPAGAHLGTIETPEAASNLNWGGPDRTTLYITASTSLYRVRLKVAGNPVPFTLR